MGRPSIWAEHRNEMVQMYIDQKMSRGQIARHFDTSAVTITRQLKAAGVEFEDRVGDNPNDSRSPERRAEIAAKISASRKGKGTGPRVEREQRTCVNEDCKKSYTYIPGRSGEKFCSRACSVSVTTENTTQAVREAYVLDPVLCPCGLAINYEHRNTRQYCSEECRKTYSTKRQKDLSKWVTFNCETCQKETTKRVSSGNKNRFCSNACAAKHTKTVRHYVCRESDMVLDSTWEMLFAGLMGFLKISCERFDRTQAIEWRDDRWYAPDFLVTIDNQAIAVEVKGLEDEDDSERWVAFLAAYPNLGLVVLDRARLNILLHDDPTVVLPRWVG